MNLFLKTFRLVGIEKNYEINFIKGLNVISGPTSTGKTTIFELIDYAFGSKAHKSYIEVGTKCTDVELEFEIKSKLYRIKRTLFKFELPILVEVFNEDEKKFEILGTFVDRSKDYEKTLSAFLLSKLGLDGVKVSSQNFSFRDLFKFSYLKQTEIDNEDILSEKNWPVYNKQKAAFEIIFNFYDELIGELKNQFSIKQEEFKNEAIKLTGIQEFLKQSNVENYDTVDKRKKEIDLQIEELTQLLNEYKEKIIIDSANSMTQELEASVIKNKKERNAILSELADQKQYIQKLITLSNQYTNDIEKIDAAIMGVREINKYDFKLCPNCLQPLSTHKNSADCTLCGNSMENLAEQVIELKSEKRSINTKQNELEKHIVHSMSVRDELVNKTDFLTKKISQNERILTDLTESYVNPYLQEISFINLSLGKLYSENDELDNSLRFIKELNRLHLVLKEKQNELEDLKGQIDDQVVMNNKTDVITMLNVKFNEILEKFHFPKLSNAYIDPKKYIPYIRGRKYNDLGSLGAVTLLTVAYYLTILVEASSKEINSNHLNLLMIDTPSKNLGVSSKSTEFQDEEIFKSIISYFVELDKNMSSEIQLIVINNGYPDILPTKNIIKEFSSDGNSGLIDDI
ncbi:DNA recombination protein RecN [Enterococcus faecium]|nr:DNA recombination protein RecN [Enterococcus faecium]